MEVMTQRKAYLTKIIAASLIAESQMNADVGNTCSSPCCFDAIVVLASKSCVIVVIAVVFWGQMPHLGSLSSCTTPFVVFECFCLFVCFCFGMSHSVKWLVFSLKKINKRVCSALSNYINVISLHID